MKRIHTEMKTVVIQIVRRSTIIYHEGKTDSKKFESDSKSSCEKFKEETEIESKECYMNSIIEMFKELVEESRGAT